MNGVTNEEVEREAERLFVLCESHYDIDYRYIWSNVLTPDRAAWRAIARDTLERLAAVEARLASAESERETARQVAADAREGLECMRLSFRGARTVGEEALVKLAAAESRVKELELCVRELERPRAEMNLYDG